MKTSYKMVVSGLTGGAIVVLAITAFTIRQHLQPPAQKPVSDPPNVVIKVESSKPLYSSQQNQVYATVEQIIQAHTPTSLDASGFVQYVYAKVGVSLPRTIAEQAQTGTRVPQVNQLQKGDLVVFNVGAANQTVPFDGIFLGGNQFAAVTGHGLMAISMSDPYWAGKFLYGRRVL